MNFDLYVAENKEALANANLSSKAGALIYKQDAKLFYFVDEDGKVEPINFDRLHPLGSVYVSTNSDIPFGGDGTNPGTGTWTKFDDFVEFVNTDGSTETLYMWKRTK